MPAVTFRPPPSPGEFSRPYLESGQAREAAPTVSDAWSSAAPPSTSTPDPGDYRRGPLIEGHQRLTFEPGAVASTGPESGTNIDRTIQHVDDDYND
jgi:hypothetical protein